MTSWRTALAVCRLLPIFLLLGVLKHILSLPMLARWSWRRPRGTRRADVNRIASLVLRTGSLAGLPDRDCLQRSLLLYRELSGAGFQPELVVGFRRIDGRVLGHAWVCVGGEVLGEPAAALAPFEPTVRFGVEGQVIGDVRPGGPDAGVNGLDR